MLNHRNCFGEQRCCTQRRHSCCCYPAPCFYFVCGSYANGKSAYEIAVEHGFIGTEEEWLESLKGEPGPFLSCFAEAMGNAQTVATGRDFAFDTDPDILEIVGEGISLDASGTVFTVTRPGLYRIEWSMNMSNANTPVLVGLFENGGVSSLLSNNALVGNYSSGALIEVTEDDLPYSFSLRNYGAPITVANPRQASDTAVSIRITRFADGASA